MAIAIIASAASLSAQQEEYKSISLHHKALNEKQPIRIEVCSSKIKSILNTSDMSLNIHRDSFANWLEIINTPTLFINGKSLTAKDKIELYNTGTMTSNIKGYTADNLMLTNTGYLYVKGKVDIISTGRASIRTSELNK